jgi:hypothetical protein
VRPGFHSSLEGLLGPGVNIFYKCVVSLQKGRMNSTEDLIITVMEHEILVEMSKLLEKTGMENTLPIVTPLDSRRDQFLETALINLKNLNARYEKSEAINQVRWLMNTYNIQIDELMERISS